MTAKFCVSCNEEKTIEIEGIWKPRAEENMWISQRISNI
jgi:hypothetical protein